MDNNGVFIAYFAFLTLIAIGVDYIVDGEISKAECLYSDIRKYRVS